MLRAVTCLSALLLCQSAPDTLAGTFALPTANRALFETDGGERFFVGTTGKPWTSGQFGCVRTDGWQMHEGIDIRCLQRDRDGEPTDPVLATADGVVAYVNSKPGLSNYGNYIVLRHAIEKIEVYSTYAHLRRIREELKAGDRVKAGEEIATMGRTANTREGITKDRAHLHFEINLLVNERFPVWYKKEFPGQRNDHGQWNGQNMLGLDPALVFRTQQAEGPSFSLLQFIRSQEELCRVVVRDRSFPWVGRYTPLIRRNPTAEKHGIAGFEVALNYNGLPFQLIPRAESEIKGKAKIQILSVNEAEQKRHPCRKLVTEKGGRWQLTSTGQHLIELLTY